MKTVMSCPYCHGTRRIAVEPGSSLRYPCPDCTQPIDDDDDEAASEIEDKTRGHARDVAHEIQSQSPAALMGAINPPKN